MRWPWQKKALTADYGALETLQESTFQPFPLLGGGSRQRIQEAYNTAKTANYAWMYESSPAVRTVIDAIVDPVGQLDLRLYEEVAEDERNPDPDHPAALSLRYPNETTSGDSFVRQMMKDFLIADDAFAVVTPASGGQIGLLWTPYHMVEVMGLSLWRADGYRVHRRDGTWIDFTDDLSDPYRVGGLDHVLHWHGENPRDPRIGLSKLESLRNVIAEDVAVQTAIVELAKSGLTQPLYGYRPLEAPVVKKEALEALEEDMANRLKRVHRRPFVLQEGTELRPVGVNPKDAEMMAVRRWILERVAAAFGVPLEATEEGREAFVVDTLSMYCEKFTRMLNHQVLVRLYDWTDGCFEFDLDEKLMGTERIKTYVAASGRAVMTTDEARAKLNLPPIDGGDELVTPLNVMVGDNPKPSPAVNPPQNPNAPSDGGEARNPQGLPTENRRAELPRGKAEEYERVPILHPGLKAEIDRQHENIDLAQAEIQRYFTRLSRALNPKKSPDGFDWDKAAVSLAAGLYRVVREIVRTEGHIYAMKLTGVFDMGRVRNYLDAMADATAAGINDKVREEVEELGVEAALAKAPQHVASAGIGLGAQATRWAREEAARQSPFPESRVKTWIPDTQRHAAFAGQTVPLADPWPAGFAPGTKPGCKCSMAIR